MGKTKKLQQLDLEEKSMVDEAQKKNGYDPTPSATTVDSNTENVVYLSQSEINEIDDADNGSTFSRLSTIGRLIKKLSFGADLTNTPIPGSFILPKSALSYFAENYSTHFNVLLSANGIDDDLERFLQVLRYFTTTSREIEDTTRKPLNPVLGETYQAKVEFKQDDQHQDTNNYFFSEQISHHPPISCSCVYNKEKGVRVTYFHPVKSQFMGTYVKLTFEGESIIHLDKHDEVITSSIPYMAIRVFRGFSEYCGKAIITSNKHDYRIKINYNAKPLLGGSYNSIDGTVYKGKEKLYKIKGQWSGDMKITNIKTNESKPFFSRPKEINSLVLPQELPSTHSTVVWKGVIEAGDSGVSRNITVEKTKVEEAQRKLAAERKQKGEHWKPIHFTKVDDVWVLNEFKD
ncbi:hypothetical protein CYY_003771 [Polysphondylium violaceum]|uniref:Oxysterol binding family protein n=1 Tax=Polysphondylium violaceum TaxID=133409 RepID=A0A8J4V0W2_9MYCE|nr:hypothetical protein CYY_003771 [Polysphondylium violaceum]